MRQDTRLSSAVPHSTAFLPPAFMAMLPPMQEASAEVGSTAKTKPARSAASATRWVTTPASVQMVGNGCGMAGDGDDLDLGHGLELLGVDHRALPGQRDRAAGVAGAAAARDDGQAQLDAALDQPGHLGLGVGGQHHERVLDAPVGGVGHVRDARQAVELDVVLGRVGGAAPAASGAAARPSRGSWRRRPRTARRAACSSSPTRRIALGVGVGRAALARPRPGGGAARRPACRRRLGLSSRSSCR